MACRPMQTRQVPLASAVARVICICFQLHLAKDLISTVTSMLYHNYKAPRMGLGVCILQQTTITTNLKSFQRTLPAGFEYDSDMAQF